MFDMALVLGIALTLAALAVFAVIAILVLRRQGRHGRHDHGGSVPPPVDPGPSEPEQARDVNADKDDKRHAERDARRNGEK
jgi:hypothetical protein